MFYIKETTAKKLVNKEIDTIRESLSRLQDILEINNLDGLLQVAEEAEMDLITELEKIQHGVDSIEE